MILGCTVNCRYRFDDRSSNVIMHCVCLMKVQVRFEKRSIVKVALIRACQVHRHNDPRHEISNNVVCSTRKASDQPAHTRSLIRAFASEAPGGSVLS